MINKVLTLLKDLEDPDYPILGPTLKALHLFGYLNPGSKFRTILYRLIDCISYCFVFTQFIDLYIVRHDINKVIDSISVLGLAVVCIAKRYSCVMYQVKWNILCREVSMEEFYQKQKEDPLIEKHVNRYTRYMRIITYMYWFIVLVTNMLLILAPFLKYISSKNYRQKIFMGQEPLPQILRSWFPFDVNKMPGYLIAVTLHIFMAYQGSGTIASYDMNVVAIMIYLKGQLIILREKCKSLFDDIVSLKDVECRIKEYHRHHNALIKHYEIFNSLLSPIMSLYVLICSITICGSVIQINLGDTTASQKIWIIQYTCSLVLQLFMYCWHSNEITIQVWDGHRLITKRRLTKVPVLNKSLELDRGIYESDWWQGNVRSRRQLLLLAGKLNHPFILSAGPFTVLSVHTFISILKGAYSFYTLLYQIQEKNNRN